MSAVCARSGNRHRHRCQRRETRRLLVRNETAPASICCSASGAPQILEAPSDNLLIRSAALKEMPSLPVSVFPLQSSTTDVSSNTQHLRRKSQARQRRVLTFRNRALRKTTDLNRQTRRCHRNTLKRQSTTLTRYKRKTSSLTTQHDS